MLHNNPLHSNPVPEFNRLKEALSQAAANWVFNLSDRTRSGGVQQSGSQTEGQQHQPYTYMHQNFQPDQI